MKVVALMPFWSGYQPTTDSIECRPIVNIGGKSLITRTIEIANQINLIKEVVIFASNDKITNYLDDNAKYKFLKRDRSLDSNKASIEDIIEAFLQKSDADVIVLIHPKCPFIKPQTIQECIEKVATHEFDSAFVANLVQKYTWFKGKRLNYSKDADTPSLLDIEPVLIEASSVYVFTRALFNKCRNRIGPNPYIREISHFEGFEIDREDDFEIAELIINAGLDKKGG